jgi:hypothetical protein
MILAIKRASLKGRTIIATVKYDYGNFEGADPTVRRPSARAAAKVAISDARSRIGASPRHEDAAAPLDRPPEDGRCQTPRPRSCTPKKPPPDPGPFGASRSSFRTAHGRSGEPRYLPTFQNPCSGNRLPSAPTIRGLSVCSGRLATPARKCCQGRRGRASQPRSYSVFSGVPSWKGQGGRVRLSPVSIASRIEW